MNPPRRTRLLFPGLSSSSCLSVIILICIETVMLSKFSDGHRIFYMHWNTTNSIFRIDNTDHIIDVNKGNLAYEFDQVHIICPVYEPGTFDNETEKYIIYNVSKIEYETCRITNANPRIIAICDKPQKLMYFTITFRPFSPQPGGLEFQPGNDYYFISTSSKDDLHRRIGGRCSTNNMKVVFKVCCAQEENQHQNITALVPSTSTTANNNIPDQQQPPQQHSTGVSINQSKTKTPVQFSQQVPQSGAGGSGNMGTSINSGRFVPAINTNTSNIVQSTMNWPQQTPTSSNNNNNHYHQQQPFNPSYVTSPRPPTLNSANNNYNNNNSPSTSQTSLSNSHKPTKKTNEYDKHPNEVVKNEELTYNSSSGRVSATTTSSTSSLIVFTTTFLVLIKQYTNLLLLNFTNSWCQR